MKILFSVLIGAALPAQTIGTVLFGTGSWFNQGQSYNICLNSTVIEQWTLARSSNLQPGGFFTVFCSKYDSFGPQQINMLPCAAPGSYFSLLLVGLDRVDMLVPTAITHTGDAIVVPMSLAAYLGQPSAIGSDWEYTENIPNDPMLSGLPLYYQWTHWWFDVVPKVHLNLGLQITIN